MLPQLAWTVTNFMVKCDTCVFTTKVELFFCFSGRQTHWIVNSKVYKYILPFHCEDGRQLLSVCSGYFLAFLPPPPHVFIQPIVVAVDLKPVVGVCATNT